MRILLNTGIGTEVIEIIEAGYDTDNSIPDYSKDIVSGFYFTDTDNNDWCIPNISINECQNITYMLLKQGYADLSIYGEYYKIE